LEITGRVPRGKVLPELFSELVPVLSGELCILAARAWRQAVDRVVEVGRAQLALVDLVGGGG
jgi:uncharacterized protein YjeT (DUF2065 family)